MDDSGSAAAVSPAKGKKGTKGKAAPAKKPKAPASHPKYLDMVVAALKGLKDRQGSSRQAILKYIGSHYSLGKDSKTVNTHLKLALKRGTATGVLKHSKGQGASGSFRLSATKQADVVEKKPVAKKTGGTRGRKPGPKKAAPKAAAPKKETKVVAAPAATPKKRGAPKKTKPAAKSPKPKKAPKKAAKSPKAKKAKTPKKKAAKSPKKTKK